MSLLAIESIYLLNSMSGTIGSINRIKMDSSDTSKIKYNDS